MRGGAAKLHRRARLLLKCWTCFFCFLKPFLMLCAQQMWLLLLFFFSKYFKHQNEMESNQEATFTIEMESF